MRNARYYEDELFYEGCWKQHTEPQDFEYVVSSFCSKFKLSPLTNSTQNQIKQIVVVLPLCSFICFCCFGKVCLQWARDVVNNTFSEYSKIGGGSFYRKFGGIVLPDSSVSPLQYMQPFSLPFNRTCSTGAGVSLSTKPRAAMANDLEQLADLCPCTRKVMHGPAFPSDQGHAKHSIPLATHVRV